MQYLAVDPGKHIGYAEFSATGELIYEGQITGIEVFEIFLDSLPDVERTVILEDYRLFKHKALQQSGDRIVASECIGSCESWARRRKYKVERQAASILTIAQLWAGRKMPGNHAKSHSVSAYLHGYYYLVKKQVIKLEV